MRANAQYHRPDLTRGQMSNVFRRKELSVKKCLLHKFIILKVMRVSLPFDFLDHLGYPSQILLMMGLYLFFLSSLDDLPDLLPISTIHHNT